MSNLSVFVLAAGLGERLRPITAHIPKPLLPILGRPILQHVLERASLLSPVRIGLNVHHKGDLITAWLGRSGFLDRVVIFHEDPILGTGGALKNAGSLLSEMPFLVHNADILSDIDLKRLIETHNSSGSLATLAVHDFPAFNNLLLDDHGALKEVSTSPATTSGSFRLMAFTGIAVYDPSFLAFLPSGASSVVDAWHRAISSGKRIATFDVTGSSWSDIGTPSAYTSAVVEALRDEGETIYLHPSSKGCEDIEVDGYLAVEEDCSLGNSASLINCIVLPGTPIPERASYENCIIGRGFSVQLEESGILGLEDDEKTIPIGTGGSDRRYFRVRGRHRDRTVLMRAGEGERDFERQIEYSRFFFRYGLPVPDLKEVDFEKKEAVFEDLGDISLYSWLACRRPEEEVEAVYRRVLDAAVLLHTTITDHISDCPLLREEVFDYDHLRWETTYFLDQFVKGLLDIKVESPSALGDDLNRLAEESDAFSKTVIHRDFQSQNIMVMKGAVPRVIDFQGARIGPPAYDIASLLWDPYHRLSDTLRERLVAYYVRRREREEDFDALEFTRSLLPCRLQRHMQALGAYAFLSQVKGKRYFLKHVAEGLRLLIEDAALTEGKFPALYRLITRLAQSSDRLATAASYRSTA